MLDLPTISEFIETNSTIRPDVIARIYPTELAYITQETSFLPPGSPLRQRYFHILTNQMHILLCNVCEVNPRSWIPVKREYSTTCSRKCAANCPSRLEKTIATNMQRYGGKAPACNSTVREKMEASLLETYPDGFKSQQLIEKRQATCLEKYGVDNPSKSVEVAAKITKSINETFQKHNEKISKQRSATYHEHTGYTNPSNNPNVIAQRRKTNNQLYGRNHPRQQLLSLSTYEALHDPNWLRTQHHELERPITNIATELNIDKSALVNYYKAYEIELKKFAHSSGERGISSLLMEYNINHIQNTKSVISPLELDIYIPSHNVAIEYCGLYWHSDRHDRIDNQYHLRKLKKCNAAGIKLITIFEDEWMRTPELVKSKLLHILKCGSTDSTIYARKCDIVEITDTNQKDEFFNNTHIQGSGPGSVTLSLQHNNEIVAMMTFIIKQDEVILNRYATSCNVPGGFSKLLTAFIRQNQPIVVTTFADRRWSEGDVYTANGFVQTKILPPDYRYVVGGKRIHKFNYRHKYLATKLKEYDPTKSEVENTRANGIYRIFDCGLIKYQYHPTYPT